MAYVHIPPLYSHTDIPNAFGLTGKYWVQYLIPQKDLNLNVGHFNRFQDS